MVSLLGFEITRKREERQEVKSIVPPVNDDGAMPVSAGGVMGTYVDLDGSIRTDAELVTKYRDMAQYPDCDQAVEEITNEAISISGSEDDIVKIRLDNVTLPDPVKVAIEEEFKQTLRMLQFNTMGHDLFRRWYVDGRLYFHVVTDKDQDTDMVAMKELRYIDPRKIKKIREITRKKIEGAPNQPSTSDMMVTATVNEYFLYNEKGFGPLGPNGPLRSAQVPSQGVKIAVDSIIYVPSGITDPTGTYVIGHLQKAIKTLNQLKALEDATVIYRLVRAPERRVWKIDVSNLPRLKADQYMTDQMTKYKNRLVYDSTTGEIRDDRKFLTMLEDIWLPVRGGNAATDVDTLPAGELTGVLDDVAYFQKKLYNALNVPLGRMNNDNNIFNTGRATEVTRDEVTFAKFIFRLRQRFCDLFLQILEKQLILKNVILYDEWKDVKQDIRFDFAKDNEFAELRDLDVLQNRLAVMAALEPFLGKVVSWEWARRNVLKQNDQDIEEIDMQIDQESIDPKFAPPPPDPMMMGGGDMPPDQGPEDPFGGPPQDGDPEDPFGGPPQDPDASQSAPPPPKRR